MTQNIHHIVVGDRTFCEVTGSLAGLEVADKSGVSACTHTSAAAAERAAKALRPFFKRGKVRVVKGDCEHAH